MSASYPTNDHARMSLHGFGACQTAYSIDSTNKVMVVRPNIGRHLLHGRFSATTERRGWALALKTGKAMISAGSSCCAANGILAPVRVGLVVPLSDEGRGGRSWRELKSIARAAERGGVDSLWVHDHLLYRYPNEPERGIHEASTVLGALAAS